MLLANFILAFHFQTIAKMYLQSPMITEEEFEDNIFKKLKRKTNAIECLPRGWIIGGQASTCRLPIVSNI